MIHLSRLHDAWTNSCPALCWISLWDQGVCQAFVFWWVASAAWAAPNLWQPAARLVHALLAQPTRLARFSDVAAWFLLTALQLPVSHLGLVPGMAATAADRGGTSRALPPVVVVLCIRQLYRGAPQSCVPGLCAYPSSLHDRGWTLEVAADINSRSM